MTLAYCWSHVRRRFYEIGQGGNAPIILPTGEGCGTAEVMRPAGVSKLSVWRWQERFITEGVDGPGPTTNG